MGVSVLVASYNCENYVEECLKCLLNQSYKDVEIIVCDDCSTDNTRTILRRYANEGKIILLENDTNNGAAQSRNNCLAVAIIVQRNVLKGKLRFWKRIHLLILYQPGYRNSMRQGKR